MSVFSINRLFHKKFCFTVEVPGFGWVGFMECSAIRMKTAEVKHFEGGALAPHKAPGLVETDNITLKRGATVDRDAWNWFKLSADASAMVAEPNHEKTVSIVQRDRRQKEVERWVLPRCWVTEWSGGDWNNAVSENRIEEMVLSVRWAELGGDNPI